jgi:hypothetical protein
MFKNVTRKQEVRADWQAAKARVALLTDHRFVAAEADPDDWYLGNILRDDALLQQALDRRGVSSVRVDWADPSVDWSSFELAVFRTTWDYYERYAEFAPWLEQTSKIARLCNAPEIIRWNMDKHYLLDLQHQGVPVVPFHMLETGTLSNLSTVMQQKGWPEAVVKPCVSGGARLTYRVNSDNADQIDEIIRIPLQNEAFLLQPFVDSIQVTGEDSLMVFGGQYTHAVRKTAKAGDFRVQDDHGGTVHDRTPDSSQVHLAETAMKAATQITGHAPAYGRADMVQMTDGTWAIMELELLEPELWLRYAPAAADVFAENISRILAKG